MKIESLINRVESLNTKIGGQWKPEFQLLWILEELGEIAREFLRKQDLPAKNSDYNVQRLMEEIGDVLYGLISFTQSLDLDIIACLRMAIEKFELRHQ